jgi:t-SNARE complex subunit (syntaxin)
MKDINAISNDIAEQVDNQGKKLEKLDENMVVADTNAADAL